MSSQRDRIPYPSNTPKKRSTLQKYKFFRRLLHVQQMDFEVAFSQMFYLCVAPQKVYQLFKYSKVTKDQYARDDPAFLVLLAFFLCISSVICAIVFGLSLHKFVTFLLWVIFVDCIGTGVVIASVLWFFSNKYLREHVPHTVDQSVEWGYAFDVHCNAFFPLLVILHVLQLFLIKFIEHDWLISTIIADTLWLVAISYYMYITFLGYQALSFLRRTNVFLYPIALVIVLYVVAVALNWNISLTVFRYYGVKA
eukprot:m.44725 g.44725  ORF g.44725 m.44725 type:complete len:252 (+) comp12359_c0_seq2:243-998(+)